MKILHFLNIQNMHTNLFYKLLFVAFMFLGTKNFASAGEYNYTSHIPHFKAIFSPLQYLTQIAVAKGYDKFNRFFPCGGIMIYSRRVDHLYLEIGVNNYKNFNFMNTNVDKINITAEILEKIKNMFSYLFSLLSFFTNKKESSVKSDEKEYKKVFFARLGFSFNSPLNYLINNPLNTSKIDILIEFPVRYDGKWFNIEKKGKTTAWGGEVFTNSYYKNINIIFVPLRFINRNFSTRISIFKINLNDIEIILGNLKKNNNINKNIIYLFIKGFSAEFVFNFASIIDSLLSRI